MGCSFSIILAILGYLYGGLGGALGGFLFGAFIDAIINRAGGRNGSAQHYYKPQDFTDDKLILAAYVAKADNNRLLRSEMEYVRQFLLRDLGSSAVQSAMLRFRDILNSDIDIVNVCADLRQHATIYEKLIILQFLFGFAQADGSIRQEELDAIQHISDLCGIPRSTFESLKSMFVGSSYYGGGGYYEQQQYGGGGSSSTSYSTRTATDNDYRILEVSPDASDEEVKKAYRAAAKKHHPDKVSHLGEDVRKAAEVKFAQVNEAYERIKKARGMN